VFLDTSLRFVFLDFCFVSVVAFWLLMRTLQDLGVAVESHALAFFF